MESKITRSLYYKIGVAGFCFGNSMLFSFPEYLGFDTSEEFLKTIFSYLNLLLGIPVSLVVVSPLLPVIAATYSNVPALLLTLGIVIEHGMLVNETATTHLKKLTSSREA